MYGLLRSFRNQRAASRVQAETAFFVMSDGESELEIEAKQIEAEINGNKETSHLVGYDIDQNPAQNGGQNGDHKQQNVFRGESE